MPDMTEAETREALTAYGETLKGRAVMWREPALYGPAFGGIVTGYLITPAGLEVEVETADATWNFPADAIFGVSDGRPGDPDD